MTQPSAASTRRPTNQLTGSAISICFLCPELDRLTGWTTSRALGATGPASSCGSGLGPGMRQVRYFTGKGSPFEDRMY